MSHPEGDILPFRMTAEQRRTAIEKNSSRRKPEWDDVQLFRAKPEPKAPRPPSVPAQVRIKACTCCGHKVKVKIPGRRRPPAPPQKRWWLYYGPGRMTGGFLTKRDARNWYLNGGR